MNTDGKSTPKAEKLRPPPPAGDSGEDGVHLKTLTGYIKGVNLGGWLSQCDYTEAHCKRFITEKDIRTIAAWGFDHIRLPVDIDVIEGSPDPKRGKGHAHISNAFEWCGKYGLNMVLDLHKAAGYAFYGADNTLFDNVAMQDKFIQTWEDLASRYAEAGEGVAFELLNEIVEEDSSRWNALIKRTVPAIRKIAPKTKIILGGINWSSVHTLSLLEKPEDDGIVYTFHFYEPFLFTHQKARWIDAMPKNITTKYPATMREYQELSKSLGLFGSGLFGDVTEMGAEYMKPLMAEAVDAAARADAALYCGEYGVISHAPAPDTARWYADTHKAFTDLGIGRALWTYKGKSFGLADRHLNACREAILRHI